MRNRTLPSAALVASVLGLLVSPAARAQLPLGGPVLVNVVTTGDQEEPAIAMSDDGAFSVLWSDSSGSDIEVLRSKFASDGTPSSPTVLNQFLAGQQRNASVSINASGEFLAAWTSNDQVTGSGKDLFARRTGAGGLVLTGEFQVNATTAHDTRPPKVARAADGSYVAIWRDANALPAIQARKFAADGTPVTGDFVANPSSSLSDFGEGVAAFPDGSFVIVWTGADSSFHGILARCFDAAGDPLGDPFEVTEEQILDQEFPVVAADSRGGFVVAWQSEFPAVHLDLRRFDANCLPLSGDLPLGDSTGTPVDHLSLDMAADGAFVAAWSAGALDGDGGFAVREFTKAGLPVGGSYLAVLDPAGVQASPGVAIGDRIFAVAWQDQETGSLDDIYVRRFARRVLFDDDFEDGGADYWSAVVP